VTNTATVLIQHSLHQVRGFYELVIATKRRTLGLAQGQLELRRQLVHSHYKNSEKMF
jgi:hypothetical protein